MSDLDPTGQPADPNWHGKKPNHDLGDALSDMAKTPAGRAVMAEQTPERIADKLEPVVQGLTWVAEAEVLPNSEPPMIGIETTDGNHFFLEVHPG